MEGTNTLSAWIKNQDRDQLIRTGFRVIFFLFAWFYLGVVKGDLLFRLSECNYFLFDGLYVKDILSGKSGALVLMSRFLLQFCCYPLLGAAIIAILLSGMEFIISKMFHIKKDWFIIGFIPSISMIYMFTSVSYEIFDTFEFSYVTSTIIGFYYALLIFFIYKKTENYLWLTPILTIIVAGSSIWMGPSAAVAFAMMGADALFGKKFIKGASTLLLGGAIYYFAAQYASYHITPAFMCYSLSHPWPILYFRKLFFVTITTHLISIIALTSLQVYQDKKNNKKEWINPAIGVVLIAVTIFGCRYKFTFKEELRIQRLAHEMKWEQMVEEMEEMDVSSRFIAAYRVIALIGTNQLNEKIFNYNYSYSHPGFYKYYEEMGFYPEFMLAISYPQISYRWCMEFTTDSNKKIYLISIMALCSFVNEEYELARRYCNLLTHTLYYKNWAKEMISYLDRPDEYLKKYPILKTIKDARPFIERTGVVRGVATIFDLYRALPRISAERRILTKLYRRKLDEVEKEVKISKFMKTGIPRCMQEGIILKAILSQNMEPLKQFPLLDQKVYDYVYSFVEYYKLHHADKDVALQMKEKFGYSYCHYFSFGIGSTLTKQDKK